MKVRDITVPTTATNLHELAKQSQRQWSQVFLQAPEANSGTVFFGDASFQLFELRPKANAMFSMPDTQSLYIVGTSGDKLTVGFQ